MSEVISRTEITDEIVEIARRQGILDWSAEIANRYRQEKLTDAAAEAIFREHLKKMTLKELVLYLKGARSLDFTLAKIQKLTVKTEDK